MPDARKPADPPTPDPGSGAAFGAARADALAFLAGGVAHDLANPLGAILAFASYLASDPRLPDDLRDDARLLREEADRTHRIVRALLEVAGDRASVGQLADVRETIDEILELAASTLAGIEVVRDVVAPPAVDVDPARLRHLVLVLGVEAIRGLGEARAGGGLTVTGRAHDEALVVVLDYRRAPGSTTPQPALSPAIAAAADVARSLGGSLRSAATVDGGTYELTLPIAARSRDGEGDDTPVPTVLPTVEAPVARVSPVVLVCDDEPSIRSLLVRVLRHEGFGTLVASSGDEALALLRSSPVDVVLTDQHMEGMSGIELFERAAADDPEHRPPFVVMTGEPDADDLVQLAEHADVTVLPKPFETGAVAETIRELVDPEGYLG